MVMDMVAMAAMAGELVAGCATEVSPSLRHGVPPHPRAFALPSQVVIYKIYRKALEGIIRHTDQSMY